MTNQTPNEFKTTSWDEPKPEAGNLGPRIACAHVTDDFSGVIQGSAATEYVMYYSGQDSQWGGPGSYTGLSQVTGRVAGREGSFVLAHTGTFEGTTVSGSWTVVDGSGTGELAGLRGDGGFVSSHGNPATAYTFVHRFGS